jgi:hypothetical protein
MRVLRSVITPFCRRNAVGLKLASSDRPTTWPLSFNAAGCARNIPGKRAEVLHTGLFGPQEGVKSCVAGQVRKTNHLILVIEVIGEDSHTMSRSAEATEVSHGAFLPEQGVKSLEIGQGIRAEGCAIARRANNITVVVDPEGNSVGVAAERREFGSGHFPR